MNKLLLLLAALFCLLDPTQSEAETDTAGHRKLYADVNKALSQMKLSKATYKVPDMDFSNELRIWSEGGMVRKIEALGRDDSGDVVAEYYFANNLLVFVFEVTKGFRDRDPKQYTVNEVRYYFKDGKIFKIIGGLEKVAEKDKKVLAEDGKARADSARGLLKFAQSAMKK